MTFACNLTVFGLRLQVNKGIDSTILLRDVINGNSVEHHIPLFSPLIQSVEVGLYCYPTRILTPVFRVNVDAEALCSGCRFDVEKNTRLRCISCNAQDASGKCVVWFILCFVPAIRQSSVSAFEHCLPLCLFNCAVFQVMERAFIYQGKLKGKRVRPARIYYIRNLDQKFYRITGGGGSDN